MDTKSHHGVRAYLLIVAVLLSVTLYLTHERLLLAVGDFLVVRDRLEPADVIHVIAGEDYRTDYAIHLYKQGYGRLLFFTGGWCSFHHLFHGQHGRERALEQGVPLQAIEVDESPVSSTYSEVTRLKTLIEQRKAPVLSVIVVSDPHHMRRARWAYKKVLGRNIRVEMEPVPFECSPYKELWWTDVTSRRMVKAEYLKFAYYYARYQFSWGPLKKLLASLDAE